MKLKTELEEEATNLLKQKFNIVNMRLIGIITDCNIRIQDSPVMDLDLAVALYFLLPTSVATRKFQSIFYAYENRNTVVKALPRICSILENAEKYFGFEHIYQFTLEENEEGIFNVNSKKVKLFSELSVDIGLLQDVYNKYSFLENRKVMKSAFIPDKNDFIELSLIFFKSLKKDGHHKAVTEQDIENFIENFTVVHSKDIDVFEIIKTNIKLRSYFKDNSGTIKSNVMMLKQFFMILEDTDIIVPAGQGGIEVLTILLSKYFYSINGLSQSSCKDIFFRDNRDFANLSTDLADRISKLSNVKII